MQRATLESLVALGLMGLCLLGAIEAATFPGDSALLPMVALSAAALLSLIWAGQSLIARLRSDNGERMAMPAAERRRLAIVLAGVPMLGLAVQFLGFFTAFALVIPALAYALGYRSWRGLLLGVGLFGALLYVAFVLVLERPLPPEIWQGLLG